MNTLATLMDLMNKVFQLYLDQFVVVFIDYIMVYSKTEAEHDKHLRVVLHIFQEKKFMRHVIYTKGICVDPKMIEVIL